MTGSERNESETNCMNMKRALERNKKCRKMQGKGTGGRERTELLKIMGNEEKLKRKEGMCRKLT